MDVIPKIAPTEPAGYGKNTKTALNSAPNGRLRFHDAVVESVLLTLVGKRTMLYAHAPNMVHGHSRNLHKSYRISFASFLYCTSYPTDLIAESTPSAALLHPLNATRQQGVRRQPHTETEEETNG